jgi:hypothetical protein
MIRISPSGRNLIRIERTKLLLGRTASLLFISLYLYLYMYFSVRVLILVPSSSSSFSFLLLSYPGRSNSAIAIRESMHYQHIHTYKHTYMKHTKCRVHLLSYLPSFLPPTAVMPLDVQSMKNAEKMAFFFATTTSQINQPTTVPYHSLYTISSFLVPISALLI